jgi:hypothetical protein
MSARVTNAANPSWPKVGVAGPPNAAARALHRMHFRRHRPLNGRVNYGRAYPAMNFNDMPYLAVLAAAVSHIAVLFGQQEFQSQQGGCPRRQLSNREADLRHTRRSGSHWYTSWRSSVLLRMDSEPALATGHPPTVKPHCFELWLLAGPSLSQSIKRALHMSGAGVTFTLKILILLWLGSRDRPCCTGHVHHGMTDRDFSEVTATVFSAAMPMLTLSSADACLLSKPGVRGLGIRRAAYCLWQ